MIKPTPTVPGTFTADAVAASAQAAPAAYSLIRLSGIALAVLLAGLSAGFFVTYSISVTRGLAVVGDPAYVETFQAINDRVRTAGFAVFFFGAAPALAYAAWAARGSRAGALLLIATIAYVVGVLGVTFLGNIPLNERLAGYTDLAVTAAAARSEFEARWNLLNHVRAWSSLGAFAAALVGLVAAARGR